jgi:RNA polymerase sigma-70 factor (ECF subfamily)
MTPREQLWADAMRAERRGDAAAYERLLKEIADVLRRLIRYRLAQLGLGADEAEDLVQDVLIGVHTKRHSWDDRRPFLPWLHAIARYKLIDAARQLRRASRHRIELDADALAAVFEGADGAGQQPSADRDRAASELQDRLGDLPIGQQAVVRAIAIEGASVRTTAERLHTTEGAVRVSFHRARQRLIAGERGRTRPAKGKTRCL